MEATIVHQGVERKARGFSCKEVEEAGLSCAEFDALKVRWDPLRRSSVKHNVELLKKAKATMKVEPKKAKPKGEKAAAK